MVFFYIKFVYVTSLRFYTFTCNHPSHIAIVWRRSSDEGERPVNGSPCVFALPRTPSFSSSIGLTHPLPNKYPCAHSLYSLSTPSIQRHDWTRDLAFRHTPTTQKRMITVENEIVPFFPHWQLCHLRVARLGTSIHHHNYKIFFCRKKN